MTKYWHRLKTKMSDNSLVSSFLKLSEADENSGHINWLSTVKFILQYCNLGNVWLNPYTTSVGKLARQCKKVLQDKFISFLRTNFQTVFYQTSREILMKQKRISTIQGFEVVINYEPITFLNKNFLWNLTSSRLPTKRVEENYQN